MLLCKLLVFVYSHILIHFCEMTSILWHFNAYDLLKYISTVHLRKLSNCCIKRRQTLFTGFLAFEQPRPRSSSQPSWLSDVGMYERVYRYRNPCIVDELKLRHSVLLQFWAEQLWQAYKKTLKMSSCEGRSCRARCVIVVCCSNTPYFSVETH